MQIKNHLTITHTQKTIFSFVLYYEHILSNCKYNKYLFMISFIIVFLNNNKLLNFTMLGKKKFNI